MMQIQEIETIAQQMLGAVTKVVDLGFPAPGIHQVAVIVGYKENPAYQEKIDPTSAFYDPLKPDKPLGEQLIPDRRILNLNGTEDYNAIVQKLTRIQQDLVQKRQLPQPQAPLATPVAAINSAFAPPAALPQETAKPISYDEPIRQLGERLDKIEEAVGELLLLAEKDEKKIKDKEEKKLNKEEK